MATVTVEEVKPVRSTRRFILTLSEEEAASVFALTGQVAGSSSLSPRGHTSAIYTALARAGLSYYEAPETKLLKINDGYMSFEDYGISDRDRRPTRD